MEEEKVNYAVLTDEDIVRMAKKQAIKDGVKFIEAVSLKPEKPVLDFTEEKPVYQLSVCWNSQDFDGLKEVQKYLDEKLAKIKAVKTDTKTAYDADFSVVVLNEAEQDDYNNYVKVKNYKDGNFMTEEQWNKQKNLVKEFNKKLKEYTSESEDVSEYRKILDDLYHKRYEAQEQERKLIRDAENFGKYLEIENDIVKAKKYFQVAYDYTNEYLLKIVEKWEELQKQEQGEDDSK